MLRIPGEFVLSEDFTPDPQAFIEEFKEQMRAVKSVPVVHRHKNHAFFYKDPYTCTHVFLRAGPVKTPSERPYTSPHRVLERMSDHVLYVISNLTMRHVV